MPIKAPAVLLLMAAAVLPAHADTSPPSELARIDAPPSRHARRLLSIQRDALPQGWRAHLPARDGDLFVAATPPAPRPSVTVADVRREVVEPMLSALGCPGVTLDAPAHEVRPARANAERLARAMRIPDGVGGRPATRNLAEVAVDLERQLVVYPFKQILDGRPIEPGGVVVTRWEGQAPSAVRGSVICFPRVENVPTLSAPEVSRRVITTLQTRLRTQAIEPVETAQPVLLNIGTDAEGRTLLRHAHALRLALSRDEQTAIVHVWLDAQSAEVLVLDPRPGLVPSPHAQAPARTARARARVWKRDPGVGTTIAEFDIDEAGPEGYVLARAGVMARLVDHDGPPVSSSTPDFVRRPYDDWRRATCSGTNTWFHQLNIAATILRSYEVADAQGLLSRLPWMWKPAVGRGTCGTGHGMKLEHCDGYVHPRCPGGHASGVDDEVSRRNLVSWAQDNTVVVHESAHLLVPVLTHLRPWDWCGQLECAMPSAWAHRLHDLADFWADHLEWTSCFGGWVGRNLRGAGKSRDCRLHSESAWLPRLHRGRHDHFPEHRAAHRDEYADGQIAAAALWESRAGMLSIGGAAGVAQFGVRWQRAMTLTGFVPENIDASDAALYRLLYDLQAQLADQWATSLEGAGGPRTLNKVTSGFARAGLFLVPSQCLDRDPLTTEASACPNRDHGGDAIIDVDDDDASDDLRAEGVSHREGDYLKLGGRAPLFRVWTGPRYWLGPGTETTTPPCNTRFLVEVSTHPEFHPQATLASGWRRATSCSGMWRPGFMPWRRLQSAGAGAQVYYRVRTDAEWAGSERISTAPGAGLWTTPAPYAVITADGRPTY